MHLLRKPSRNRDGDRPHTHAGSRRTDGDPFATPKPRCIADLSRKRSSVGQKYDSSSYDGSSGDTLRISSTSSTNTLVGRKMTSENLSK